MAITDPLSSREVQGVLLLFVTVSIQCFTLKFAMRLQCLFVGGGFALTRLRDSYCEQAQWFASPINHYVGVGLTRHAGGREYCLPAKRIHIGAQSRTRW